MSARKRRTKGGVRRILDTKSGVEIHHFFSQTSSASPECKMAGRGEPHHEAAIHDESPRSPSNLMSSESFSNTPALPSLSSQDPSPSNSATSNFFADTSALPPLSSQVQFSSNSGTSHFFADTPALPPLTSQVPSPSNSVMSNFFADTPAPPPLTSQVPSPSNSVTSDSFADTPALPPLASQDPSPSNSVSLNFLSDKPAILPITLQDLPRHHGLLCAGSDIRSLLQALPTKADIMALISRLEESHRQAMQAVRAEVQSMNSRLSAGESSIAGLEQRVSILETSQASHSDQTVTLQLQLESMEDRSRRNNLRLRGLPEATGQEHLSDSAIAIFRLVAGDTLPADIEFDRIHRALGPRSADPNRPRDVICRLHRYTHKEIIIRKAWGKGDTDFDGAPIKILPDVSRATLQRRAILKPLLDLARQHGYLYRWGFPLSVSFRKDQRSYTLYTPAELPGLFQFMGVTPIPVPNWLLPLSRLPSRMYPVPAPRSQRLPRRPSTVTLETTPET